MLQHYLVLIFPLLHLSLVLYLSDLRRIYYYVVNILCILPPLQHFLSP
nr:MAG TPA: hypothetical protein [Bacteriophage sp.]